MRITIKRTLFAITFVLFGALLQPVSDLASALWAVQSRSDTTSGHNVLRQLSLGILAYKDAVGKGAYQSARKYPTSLAELASSGYFPKKDMEKLLERWDVEYFPPADDAGPNTVILLIEDTSRVMYMRLGGDGRMFGSLK